MKIVLLVSKSHIGSLIIANSLVEKFNVVGIIKSERIMFKDDLKSIIFSIKKMGLRRNFKYFIMSFYIKFNMFISKIKGKQKILSYEDIKKKYDLPMIKLKDINSEDT